ncbi:hypothetical protein CYY_003912 [Polysphondylium violaceum]|uniref:SHSP domain-containing protein n=1 Tax=Polysphondylium violaceum TaxID=133409 RepID=A0A8J4PW79_9MYCE|nr:hypothetical protein CYY_003912 [Polysphondylium violaceum]
MFKTSSYFQPYLYKCAMNKLQTTYSPKLDVYELKDQILVEAEVIGIPKEDIFIEIKDSQLIISGEKKKVVQKRDTVSATTSSYPSLDSLSLASTSTTTPGGDDEQQLDKKNQEEQQQLDKNNQEKKLLDLLEDEFTTIGEEKPSIEEFDENEKDKKNSNETLGNIQVNHSESDPSLSNQKEEIEEKEKIETQEPTYHYHSRERLFGSFKKSIPLNGLHTLDLVNIKATLENGLLTITIPKTNVGEIIKINIE